MKPVEAEPNPEENNLCANADNNQMNAPNLAPQSEQSTPTEAPQTHAHHGRTHLDRIEEAGHGFGALSSTLLTATGTTMIEHPSPQLA